MLRLFSRGRGMARLSYADPNGGELRELVDRIVAERGSMLHLYQMLLHSPPVAEGWLGFMTAVRHKSTLSGALRELVIMRIAILNGAAYEAEQHAPIALKEGVTRAQLDALDNWTAAEQKFSPVQRAALALTDGVTRDVHVDDALFDAIRPHLSAREILELVVTIASYNMVSRVLEALQIKSGDARVALADAAPDQAGGLTRVNYFAGGVLGVDEFVTEQHYMRARLRRHNRFVFGTGVIGGLKVSVEGTAGQQTATIEPGLAIDARGEEIEIPSAVALGLPAKGKRLLVQINYAERLCRPVPVPGSPGEAPLMRPSRIEETYRASLAEEAKPVAVALARLTFTRGRWAIDRAFKAPRTRGATAR
jgi:AhpD family alkylhydroperoxidase